MFALLDIAYLSTYYTSSISDWEQHKVGTPIDGSERTDRFSFHTESEKEPFIHVDLPCRCYVQRIDIFLRAEYTHKILPFDILITNGEGWHKIDTIRSLQFPFSFVVAAPIVSLRVVKSGFGPLYFSSIRIFVREERFFELTDRLKADGSSLAYAYGRFYGLGGWLSVVASGLGYLGVQNRIKQLVVDPSHQGLLSYPRIADLSGDSPDRRIILNCANEALKEFILEAKGKYSSEKNISLYIETGRECDQDRKFVFITRGYEEPYRQLGESASGLKRRLYSRIVPSDQVKKCVGEIETKHGVSGSLDEAIGIQVRHGNGERYFSKKSGANRWGVKPPSREALEDAFDRVRRSAGEKYTTVILASDCKAVYWFAKEFFGPRFRTVFISEDIKDIGYGCNHKGDIFDRKLAPERTHRSDEDVRAFAEVLVLSKSGVLCGGDSFFFDAVVGFSGCTDENIVRIDNSDRYVVLDDSLVPVGQSEEDISALVRSVFEDNNLRLDGIFFSDRCTPNKIILYYFDEKIFSGSERVLRRRGIKSIAEKLERLRLY